MSAKPRRWLCKGVGIIRGTWCKSNRSSFVFFFIITSCLGLDATVTLEEVHYIAAIQLCGTVCSALKDYLGAFKSLLSCRTTTVIVS